MDSTFTQAGNKSTGLTIRWPGIAAILGSVWLIIAPFILGYSNVTAALLNDIIVGVLSLIHTAIVIVAASRNWRSSYLSWLTYLPFMLLAYWLLGAPQLLGYRDVTNAIWNDVITCGAFLATNTFSLMYSLNATRNAPNY